MTIIHKMRDLSQVCTAYYFGKHFLINQKVKNDSSKMTKHYSQTFIFPLQSLTLRLFTYELYDGGIRGGQAEGLRELEIQLKLMNKPAVKTIHVCNLTVNG